MARAFDVTVSSKATTAGSIPPGLPRAPTSRSLAAEKPHHVRELVHRGCRLEVRRVVGRD